MEGAAQGETVSVGPLDDDTVRPARTLSLAQTGAMALVVLATAGVLIGLAPHTLAGLGLLATTPATVHQVQPGEAVSGDACQRVTLTLTWGDGESGTVTPCQRSGVAAGDRVEVLVLPGWDPVVAGPRWQDTTMTMAALAALLAATCGLVVCARQWRAVVALRRESQVAIAHLGTVDRLLIQRGVFAKDGRARVRVSFDNPAVLPLRMALPQRVERSLLGAHVQVSAVGRTLRGRPRGPYVLRVDRGAAAPGGTVVALGRAYRAKREQ